MKPTRLRRIFTLLLTIFMFAAILPAVQPRVKAAPVTLATWEFTGNGSTTAKTKLPYIATGGVFSTSEFKHSSTPAGGNNEVDFVATNEKGVAYYQVALTVRDENTLARELKPLDSISDHNPKYLLTLDADPEASHNGIRQINTLDWLLRE